MTYDHVSVSRVFLCRECKSFQGKAWIYPFRFVPGIIPPPLQWPYAPAFDWSIRSNLTKLHQNIFHPPEMTSLGYASSRLQFGQMCERHGENFKQLRRRAEWSCRTLCSGQQHLSFCVCCVRGGIGIFALRSIVVLDHRNTLRFVGWIGSICCSSCAIFIYLSWCSIVIHCGCCLMCLLILLLHDLHGTVMSDHRALLISRYPFPLRSSWAVGQVDEPPLDVENDRTHIAIPGCTRRAWRRTCTESKTRDGSSARPHTRQKYQQAITVNNMNNGENEGTKGPLGIKNRAVWLGGKVASSWYVFFPKKHVFATATLQAALYDCHLSALNTSMLPSRKIIRRVKITTKLSSYSCGKEKWVPSNSRWKSRSFRSRGSCFPEMLVHQSQWPAPCPWVLPELSFQLQLGEILNWSLMQHCYPQDLGTWR